MTHHDIIEEGRVFLDTELDITYEITEVSIYVSCIKERLSTHQRSHTSIYIGDFFTLVRDGHLIGIS